MHKVVQECCTFLSIELERLNKHWSIKVERPLKKCWEHSLAISQFLQGQQDDIIHFFYLKQNKTGMTPALEFSFNSYKHILILYSTL